MKKGIHIWWKLREEEDMGKDTQRKHIHKEETYIEKNTYEKQKLTKKRYYYTTIVNFGVTSNLDHSWMSLRISL